MWKPNSILTLDTKTKEWSKTRFETFHQWKTFILNQWKHPGEYNFTNTECWIELALKFNKDKRYTDYHPNSKEYKEFWLTERRKCEQGIIVDNIYISPDDYFFWNYCRIPNKLEQKETFPEIWDGHYHYDLYLLLAELHGEDGAGTKARQKGISLYHVARLTRRLWFGNKYNLKIVSQEEEYVLGEWGIMQGYRNHLNEHTGWYRHFSPDESLSWEQRQEITEGVAERKKIYKGNKSKIRGLTTKMNVTKAVGGACHRAGDKIITSRGIKNVEDIKVGDYVFGKDGKQKKVLQLFTGQDDIYEIEQKWGENYYVNSNHLLCLHSGRKYRDKNLIISVREAIEKFKNKWFQRDYSGYKVQTPLSFERKYVHIDPYLLGVWLGDGYSKGADIIVNKTRDIELFHYLEGLDNAVIKEKETLRYSDEMFVISIVSDKGTKNSPLLNGLRKYNLVNNKHIPDDYLHNDAETRLQLLAGIIDTDGTFNLERHTYEISSKREDFIKQIKYLCTTLGIYSSYRKVKSKRHSVAGKVIVETEAYILRFTCPVHLDIPTKIKRKQYNNKTGRKLNKTPIKINYVGIDTYYGFECEDNIYCLQDGTITHNSKEIYITEAGINSRLKKIKEYVDPNLKMGNVKTGMFLAMGAVGELKDAADLQDFCFNPKAYNIRPIKDTFGNKEEDIAFFFPEEWNYIHQDEITGEVNKCYDTNGNSNTTLAIKLIEQEDERQRKTKDEQGYKLWKSQHPRTLQDAFDQREDNPFPTVLLKEKEQELLTKKFNIVSFFRDENNKPKHKFSNDVPVTKLKPNPNEDNRGAIVIKELPIDKPPFGLYYAGVDPIYNVDTSTSKSLMSIAIWIGYHEKNGKFCEPYPVAWYTGRHKKTHDTYQICLDLIEFYNARAVVENNVKDFIEWMIRQGKSKYAMRRRELTVIGEMMPVSTIRDEIGVRMETEFKKRAVEKMIHWLETPYSVEFDMETGEGKDLYNVSKVGDIMFIRELLRYNPKLNTDRLVANLLCLIGLQSDSNRHIINEVDYTPKEKPKNLTKGFPSPFLKNPQTQIKYLPSPFKR